MSWIDLRAKCIPTLSTELPVYGVLSADMRDIAIKRSSGWKITGREKGNDIVSRVPVKNSRFNPDLYPFEGWPYAGDRFELVSVGNVISSLCVILWW